MSRRMIVGLIVGVAAVGLTAFATTRGTAQLASLLGPEKQILLYDGDVKNDSGGIKIAPWGSGKAESVNDKYYVGPQVLKITSQGPYQGGVLQLGHAADASQFLGA